MWWCILGAILFILYGLIFGDPDDANRDYP